MTVLFLQAQGIENCLPRLPDIGLAVGMQLKHSVMALDYLHSRRHVRRLQGHVSDVIDCHAGGNLDEKTRLADLGQVTLGNRRLKGGELRLQ